MRKDSISSLTWNFYVVEFVTFATRNGLF